MTGGSPDWDRLGRAISGEVLVPGTAAYELARKPALARFHGRRPQAVVRAATAADVAETISFARRFGLRVTPRGGGHCFAGRSSTGEVIIDLTPMRTVAVGDGVATVDAGSGLGELTDALAVHGRTIPAGCGLDVGIAGLTLGGGLGILGRLHGLTCDHLQRARVVLADGRIVDCDDGHDPELFWALRGAGGGQFGVVTSLVFRTVPAPTAPDALDASLRLTRSGTDSRRLKVNLIGALHGAEAAAAELLGEFIARVGADPAWDFRRQLPYWETKRQLSGLGSIDSDPNQPPHGHMFSKSEFFRRPLPQEAIAAVLDHLAEGCGPGQARELSFTPWGGAYNRVPADATAFAHREESFLIEHVLVVDPAIPDAAWSAAQDWLGRSLVMGRATSLGVGARVPQLPRPRPGGLGGGLPRRQLRPPGPGQAGLRPRQLVPLLPVDRQPSSTRAHATPRGASGTTVVEGASDD